MQVSNVNNNVVQVKSQGSSGVFKEGSQIKGTVSAVNPDGTIIVEGPRGSFTAANTSGFGLGPGDTITLLVQETSADGNSATTFITNVNGQPMDQNVSLSELHLIDLGIMPNATNLRLYNILNRSQLPLTKEFMVNLKEIFQSLPEITDEQAAFMAANGIKPTTENLDALMNIGNLNQDLSALVDESMKSIISSFGLSNSDVQSILDAVNALTAQSISNENTSNISPVPTQAASLEAQVAALNLNTEAGEVALEAQVQQEPTAVQPQTVMTENNLPQNEGILQNAEGTQNSASANAIPQGNMEQVINNVTEGQVFIPDKAPVQTAMTNYAIASADTTTVTNEAANTMLPRVTEAVISSVIDEVMQNPQVTLKTISEIKTPELPKDLARTISALPEEAQQQIEQAMPSIVQSAKEFLSLKLINFVGEKLNIPVDKELTGAALKSSMKEISSDVSSIMAAKHGAEAQRAVTTLKLSDSTMSFVQIPVSLNDFKTNAEIYVVKREQNKQLSLENGIKLVFALNTQNMGRVESIINANTTDLNLNIRVENKPIKDAVDREISYLKSLMKETKFNLSVLKVTMIDKPVTVLNAHTLFGYKQLDVTV